MLVSIPGSAISQRFNTLKELRRVALPPRTFQLRANQKRGHLPKCRRQNFHTFNTAASRGSPTRWCSVLIPPRARAHVPPAVEEGQGEAPSLVRSPSQQAEISDSPVTGENNPPEKPSSPSKTSGHGENALLLHHDSFSPEDGRSYDRGAALHELRKLDRRQGTEKTDSLNEEFDAAHSPSVSSMVSSSSPNAPGSIFTDDCSVVEKTGISLLPQSSDSTRSAAGVPPTLPISAGVESARSVTKRNMRRCMRQVPQAAAIVTSTDIRDVENPWRGATVSSFTTVTFEPEVIVSLNLKLPSATYDAIQASNHFDVNMLRSNHEGAALAAQFARGHPASPFSSAQKEASIRAKQENRDGPSNLPTSLTREEAGVNPIALFIRCAYIPEKTVTVGDHVVIFGQVERVRAMGDDQPVGKNRTCLAYVNGSYGQVEPLSAQPSEQAIDLENHGESELPCVSHTEAPISSQGLPTFNDHHQESVKPTQRQLSRSTVPSSHQDMPSQKEPSPRELAPSCL